MEKISQKILKALNNDSDCVVRSVMCKNHEIDIIFIENFVQHTELNLNLLKPLMEYNVSNDVLETTEKQSKNFALFLQKNILSISGLEKIENIDSALKSIDNGEVVIICDNDKEQILTAKISSPPHRAVIEPPTSVVITGPREGFIEDFKTNLALIRKRLVTKSLVVKTVSVGRYTKTKVSIVYINEIASDDIVKQIEKRIRQIDIDGIIDSHYVSSYLEQRPNSLFKQVGASEKPDVISAKLLEGRVAIVVDGSPVVLTLPYILLEDIQSSDDYYQKNYKIILTRFIRVFGILVSIVLPGAFVAIQLYHYKIIPLKFLTTIINSTQGLPVSPFVEVLFVILLFEILYEASIRMPRYLGMALSIVGALILGDTAVKAGLVSPPSVMIVALSGITIYTTPQIVGQLTILRLLFVFAGGLLSFYGIILFAIFLVIYICSFDNYGVPYLSPFTPRIPSDLKDAIIKQNQLSMTKRPLSINKKNITRKV